MLRWYHWMIAGCLSLLLHGAAIYAVFNEDKTDGARALGRGGFEVSLNMQMAATGSDQSGLDEEITDDPIDEEVLDKNLDPKVEKPEIAEDNSEPPVKSEPEVAEIEPEDPVEPEPIIAEPNEPEATRPELIEPEPIVEEVTPVKPLEIVEPAEIAELAEETPPVEMKEVVEPVKPKPEPETVESPRPIPTPKPRPPKVKLAEAQKPKPKPEPKPESKSKPEPAKLVEATPAADPSPKDATKPLSEVSTTSAPRNRVSEGLVTNAPTGNAVDTQDAVGGGRLVGQAPPSYITKIREWLEQHKNYPKKAKRRRQQGVVTLAFSINRDGKVLAHSIEKVSGVSSLDKATIRMLMDSDPLPPFPKDMEGQILEFVIPVEFSLSN